MKTPTLPLLRAGAALALLLTVGATTVADAEELRLRITSYIAQHTIKPVGDAAGHLAGSYLRRGLVFLSTGEVGLYRSVGTIDMVKGKGTATGESSFVFADGSAIVIDFGGEIASRPGGGLLYDKFSGGFLRGAGRYEGITGRLVSASGVALTPFGEETRSDAYFDLVFDYSLPAR